MEQAAQEGDSFQARLTCLALIQQIGQKMLIGKRPDGWRQQQHHHRRNPGQNHAMEPFDYMCRKVYDYGSAMEQLDARAHTCRTSSR